MSTSRRCQSYAHWWESTLPIQHAWSMTLRRVPLCSSNTSRLSTMQNSTWTRSWSRLLPSWNGIRNENWMASWLKYSLKNVDYRQVITSQHRWIIWSRNVKLLLLAVSELSMQRNYSSFLKHWPSPCAEIGNSPHRAERSPKAMERSEAWKLLGWVELERDVVGAVQYLVKMTYRKHCCRSPPCAWSGWSDSGRSKETQTTWWSS